MAAKPYFRHVEPDKGIGLEWGRLENFAGDYEIFISPNPSSANATFSEQDLLGYFNQLASLKRAGR